MSKHLGDCFGIGFVIIVEDSNNLAGVKLSLEESGQWEINIAGNKPGDFAF